MSTPRLPRFWVYLPFSAKTGQVYLGFTSDLRRRVAEHNSLLNTGWMQRGRPWRLLAVRCFLDRYSAERVERQLKRSRFAKRNWIRQQQGRLQQLCRRHGGSHPLA